MVETRSGRTRQQRPSSFASTSVVLLTSVLVGLLAVSGSYLALDSVQHKTHSLIERGRYAFGGGETQPSDYWKAIPSWEEVKGYANHGTRQALPEPTLWDQAKAFVTRKPVRQVQAEAAYAQGKDKAAGAADYAKETAQQAADATYDAAGQAKEQAQSVPDKIKKLFFGMKSSAEQEAQRQRLIASEAQWRSEYNSKQSFWQKLMHVLSGPSKTPTEKHYDDAKRAGGVAYDHAGNAASEAYEAAKAAAGGAASGARATVRAGAGAAASAGDIGSRAASGASDTYDATKDAAGRAYDASKDAAGTAQEYAQAGYDKSGDAAAAAKAKADQAYQAAADAARRATGTTGAAGEAAAHRAQEAARRAADSAAETAQEAKHRAQEKYHSATA